MRDERLRELAYELTTDDDDGVHLERPAPDDQWFAPERVYLSPEPEGLQWGNVLIFDNDHPRTQDERDARLRSVQNGLLFQFVRLHTATDERVRVFAATWGRLNLPGLVRPDRPLYAWEECPRPYADESGFVWRATPTVVPEGWHPAWPPPSRPPHGPEVVYELVREWQRLAGIARNLIRFAARLHQDQSFDQEERRFLLEWQHFAKPPANNNRERERYYRRTAEKYVGYWTNKWIEAAGVRPVLWVDGPIPTFSLRTGGFGAALGLQLMLATTKAAGFAVCTSCGELYTPKRKPRAGERAFCGECGRAAANRLNQRDYAERRRAARQADNPT